MTEQPYLACKCREEAISELLEAAHGLANNLLYASSSDDDEATVKSAVQNIERVWALTTGDGYFASQVADNYGRPSKRESE